MTCFSAANPSYLIFTVTVHGGWSGWAVWTSCTNNCAGMSSRVRSCTNPPPAGGGSDCEGHHREEKHCQYTSECGFGVPAQPTEKSTGGKLQHYFRGKHWASEHRDLVVQLLFKRQTIPIFYIGCCLVVIVSMVEVDRCVWIH